MRIKFCIKKYLSCIPLYQNRILAEAVYMFVIAQGGSATCTAEKKSLKK